MVAQALAFIVRNAAGAVRGSVGGDGAVPVLMLGAGEDVSLNLSQSSVSGFGRSGQDLLIRLTDGQTITLSGFFHEPGIPVNRLYFSTDGDVTAVTFMDGGGGLLLPAYSAPDTGDLYSTFDDLRFGDGDILFPADQVEVDRLVLAPFVPGYVAGLGGLGLLAAVVSGVGGSDSNHTAPTVDNAKGSITLSMNTPDPQFPVTGKGNPGDTVTVTVGGQTQSTTIAPGGAWSVNFSQTVLLGDGTYEAVVVVTQPLGGSPITLDGPTLVKDMTPPALAITQGTASVGHVENAFDHLNGTVVGGTGEAGSTIRVTAGYVVKDTVVAANGSWSVTFTPTEMPGGERQVGLSVTATDPRGNRTVVTDSVVLDTVAFPVSIDPVAGDEIMNLAESGVALTITGTSRPGAVVTVTLGGVTQAITTGADGRWTSNFGTGTLAPGSYDAVLTARTDDATGNESVATRSIRVDTEAAVSIISPVAGDDVLNAAETAAGVILTGRTEAGSTAYVSFGGVTRPATVSADGTWTATLSGVAGGDYAETVQITSVDRAGNAASSTRTVRVDTKTAVSINAGQGAGDDVISGLERSGGVTFAGRGEPGASVSITVGGVSRAATVGIDGAWAATFATGDIAAGTREVNVIVNATDLAGNTAGVTYVVRVDTEVSDFRRTTLSSGADSVLNATEAAQGLTVTGTVESGSSVMVRFGSGVARAASVTAEGLWSLTIPPGEVPLGKSNVSLTVVATDRLGNTATLTEEVAIDTVVRSFTRSGGSFAGDGVLNLAEATAGMPINGTAEAGTTIVVGVSNGSTRTVTADASGQWQVTLTSADLPRGEASATLTMTATSREGNVAVLTEDFRLDTLPPIAPSIVGVSSLPDGSGVGRLVTETTADLLTFARVDATGLSQGIGATVSKDLEFNETLYRFTSQVPDGSYLVINTADAAGNTSSTLLIPVNTGATQVSLDRQGLAGFDFSMIDLSFEDDARMTIDARTLRNLTGPDETLLVKGGADDTVTLLGSTATGQSRVFDGQAYDIYTLGDTGATVLLDHDIRHLI